MSLYTRIAQYPYHEANRSQRVVMDMMSMMIWPFNPGVRMVLLINVLADELADPVITDQQIDALGDMFKMKLRQVRYAYSQGNA